MISQLVLRLPIWLVAVVIVGGAGVVSLGLTLLMRRLTQSRRREHHNEVLGVLFGGAGILYAVLLGFVVLAVWEGFSSAERIVNQESATLVSLYLNTETLPQPLRNQAQRGIREYTFSIIGDEFPAMQAGAGSRDTERTLFDLFGVYALLRPTEAWQQQLDGASLSRLDELELLRNQRLLASQSSLPELFWVVLVMGAGLTLMLGAPLFMEHPHVHAAGAVLLGCTLGAALFLIIALDRPFSGTASIRPDSYEQALQTYRNIDAVVAERGTAVQVAPARP